ncbi:MAG: DUF4091 domain-containing protein [Candidatus Helarchaeota archaeon]|nr:DUF4091 domain-containing protein [Candidatus Helarchaeota archaeon]
MTKLKYSLYEIVTVSLGLALLGFFGTLSFLPMEIHMMGEGHTIYWMFIFLSFSLITSFLLLSFLKQKYRFIITRIFDVAAIICLIFVIHAFLTFTQDLFEPWLVQVGWFLRYNGFIVGLFMGLVTIKTTMSLSTIISNFNDSEAKSSSENIKGDSENSKLPTMLILLLSFGFYIFAMLFYRYVSFFMLLTSIFIIEIGLILFSIMFLMNENYYNFVNSKFFDSPVLNLGENAIEAESKITKSESTKKLTNGGIISKINSKLMMVGTHPKEFWLLFIPLVLFLVFGIVTIILAPLDIIIHIAFPYEVGTMEYDMPLIQMFSIIMIILVFGSALFAMYGGRMYRRLIKYYKRKRSSFLKIFSFSLIDVLRFIGLFLVISQIVYFFEYPIYLPEIISYFLFCGMIGVGIYFLVASRPIIKKGLYATAISLLILNFYLIFKDGLANKVNSFSGEFDILFPFKFLHSWGNFLLVGIPIGFILSELFSDLVFKHTDGTDSMIRTAAITATPFLLGMILVPGNFLLNNPGGDPPLSDQTFFMFYLYCIALSIVLLVGLAFNYLVTEILIPIFIEKKPKWKKNIIKKNNPGKLSNARKKIRRKASPKKKVIGLSLTALVVVAFVGSFSIYYSFSQTYQRPILVHNPGNYLIWLQNSTERVTKDTTICTSTSPHIDAVELFMAKNEYAAFQLVWRPLGGSINSLTYQINDFEHQVSPYNISADNCSLRYIDFILEEEFPDILRPLTSLDLDKQENYVFWFDIRTPYDAVEGDYEGRLNFTFNGGQEEIITIRLHVWNFTIPNMRHLRTNIGSRSDDFDIIDNYIDHRMNDYGALIRAAPTLSDLNTTETYTCWLNTSSDTWTFNWTWWDSMVEYKLNHGMNGFSVPYPLRIEDRRDPYIENATRMLWLKNWLADVEGHLDDKNWLNYSYYYFIDEFSIFIPAPYTRQEYFNRCRILLSEMKNASPNIKIMTTTPPSEELELLRDYIDIYCPISNDRDKARWDERMEVDTEFWFYTCVGPTAPWPNSMIYDRLYATRVLLWQVWLYKVHGYLFWHSYMYYHGKYGIAFNGYGDGWFLYKQGGQLYDSLRWEMYLEGQEDYEYLWLLNATLQYLEENPGIISAGELNNYKAEFDAIVSSIVGERWVYCDHVSTLYSGRDRIGAILNNLGSVVNITALGEAQWFPPYKPGT